MTSRFISPRTRIVLGRVAVPVVALGLWTLAAAATTQIAPVGASIAALGREFAGGTVQADVVDTAKATVTGYLIAAAFGIPLGVWAGGRPLRYRVAEPLFSSTAAVPRIVLLPVFLSLLGITINAKIAMAVTAAIVPILLTSMAGTRAVNAILIKLARSLVMTRTSTVFKVVFPAALPSIMSGLRIGLSLALLAVILSELVAATQGIGLRIQTAYSLQQLSLMYGLVLLVTLTGFAANIGLWTLEKRWNH